jgi:hypothetical protein
MRRFRLWALSTALGAVNVGLGLTLATPPVEAQAPKACAWSSCGPGGKNCCQLCTGLEVGCGGESCGQNPCEDS